VLALIEELKVAHRPRDTVRLGCLSRSRRHAPETKWIGANVTRSDLPTLAVTRPGRALRQ